MTAMRSDWQKLAATTERKLGQEELVDAIIRNCGDDSRAAVIAMLKNNSTLLVELHALTGKRVHVRGH